MTTERDPQTRVVLSWLREDAHENAERMLLRALDDVATTPQRPFWTHPGRWLPLDITTRIAPVARMPWRQIAVLAVIAALIAAAVYVGSQLVRQTHTVPRSGPAGNGMIAVAQGGDILAADRPGGELRSLVIGPEYDEGPTFSPDGTKLAFWRSTNVEHDQILMIADADGTNVVPFSPAAGTALTFGSDAWLLADVDDSTGAMRVVIRQLYPTHAVAALDVAVPGSEQRFESHLPRLSPANPRELLLMTPFNPDGGNSLYVYDLATGSSRTIVEQAGYVYDVAWLPDGDHILYHGDAGARIVAADGSDDRPVDAWEGRMSPLSNDGTRFVGETEPDGGKSPPYQVAVYSISGERALVDLACGPRTSIECPTSWIWSPDDTILIGTLNPLADFSTYVQADARTGMVTDLTWAGASGPAWQRVAP